MVITSGLDRAARTELVGICRRHGMRLVGPTSFGVANTATHLYATFAVHHPGPGKAGLALQSGGVGIVLLEHLSRLGVGISSFVSLGDKDDVSGNDMLLWWKSDEATKLAVLYLDSFRSPRKFARTAGRRPRHAGPDPEHGPVRGSAAAGQSPRRGGHPAAHQAGPVRAGWPDRHGQSGRTAQHRDAGNTARARRKQGRRGGQHPRRRDARRRRVRRHGPAGRHPGRGYPASAPGLLPSVAAVAGPVDTTAGVTPGLFRRGLELVGADPGVDAAWQ